jgi:hypothetical protein
MRKSMKTLPYLNFGTFCYMVREYRVRMVLSVVIVGTDVLLARVNEFPRMIGNIHPWR